jgi:membrane protein implicated in regulation of membrane protease activity
MISGNIFSYLINNKLLLNVVPSKGPIIITFLLFTIIAYLLLLLIRYAYRKLKRTKNAI